MVQPLTRDGAALATELERALQRHVIEAWFPRCIDRESGGFRSGFDRRWRPLGQDERILEFQARQTRVAARLALFAPRHGDFAEFALHGFRYLRDVMWDGESGGWFWRTARNGSPMEGATKHGHSTAYAVQACALVFKATGERAALELAEEAFGWFDRRARDEEHGGYHGWLRRDGTVIRSASDVPPGAGPQDPLGHEVGIKDINVQGDWFESLLEFEEVTGMALAGERRAEFGRLYLEHLTAEDGSVSYAFAPDWTPRRGNERYGYGFQAAHRLWSAARRDGNAVFAQRADAVLLHAARRSAMRAGFAFDGPRGRGLSERRGRRVSPREWWVQVEALRAFAMGWSAGGPRAQAYGRMVERQWRFIERELLDERYGGVFARARSDAGLPGWLPLRRSRWGRRKGDIWKDASHETDSMVACIGLLREPAGARQHS